MVQYALIELKKQMKATKPMQMQNVHLILAWSFPSLKQLLLSHTFDKAVYSTVRQCELSAQARDIISDTEPWPVESDPTFTHCRV